MDISGFAAATTATGMSSVQQSASILVARKAMDVQIQQGSQLIDSMNKLPAPHKLLDVMI